MIKHLVVRLASLVSHNRLARGLFWGSVNNWLSRPKPLDLYTHYYDRHCVWLDFSRTPTIQLGVLIRPCMRVKKCPVYSRNSQKFSSKKKRGDSAPGCRASKLLDFRPLLHFVLEAVSLRPGTCWLFILRMHFHIGSGQSIVSLYFYFL